VRREIKTILRNLLPGRRNRRKKREKD